MRAHLPRPPIRCTSEQRRVIPQHSCPYTRISGSRAARSANSTRYVMFADVVEYIFWRASASVVLPQYSTPVKRKRLSGHWFLRGQLRSSPVPTKMLSGENAFEISDIQDWGEAHRADAFLRCSLLPPFLDPASPSAFPPVPPAPPSYPAAPGLATSPASMAVHSSLENCYASSRSISLSIVIATVERVDRW
jgi:hypothetical protein